MKKLIVLLVTLSCIVVSFVILKTINTNTIKEFLKSKYPNETFNIKSVDINVIKMEVVAYIFDSDGTESKVWKKGRVINSNYELDKAKSMIENELKEVLQIGEQSKYIKYFDIKILEDIDYSEIVNGLNPKIYLTIEYNDMVSSKINFAKVSYDVICCINKSKYNNVGTYVFYANTENNAMNLVINSEEIETNLDIILSKINIVKENKLN